MKVEVGKNLQCGAPVGDAASEVDARGFGEITDGNRNVADAKPEVHRLCQKLAVEYKVVRVLQKRDRLQYLPRIRAVRCMMPCSWAKCTARQICSIKITMPR